MSGNSKVALRTGVVFGVLGVLTGIVGQIAFGDDGGGAADAMWGLQMLLLLLCAILVIASLAMRFAGRAPTE